MILVDVVVFLSTLSFPEGSDPSKCLGAFPKNIQNLFHILLQNETAMVVSLKMNRLKCNIYFFTSKLVKILKSQKK